jgi:alkylhydroperoxidase/carboxymuconolactone decarboxylase family protein YurZ
VGTPPALSEGAKPHHRRLPDHQRNTDQLVFHLDFAKQNGNTEAELIEAITHLAFYAGWPKAFATMTVAKRVFRGESS